MYLFVNVSTGSYNTVLLGFGRLSFWQRIKLKKPPNQASKLQLMYYRKNKQIYLFLLFRLTAHRLISFCTCKCTPPFRISTIFPFKALILITSYPRVHSVKPVSLPVSFHTHSSSAFRAFPPLVTLWSSTVCSENWQTDSCYQLHLGCAYSVGLKLQHCDTVLRPKIINTMQN